MINLNVTQSSTTNSAAEQTADDNQGKVIFTVVLLASALLGCSLALLALGRDFFIGKNVPIVFVGALVWVDFIGVFSTAVLIFHGLIEGEEWMADSPQCSLQGFFSLTFGLSSGAVITFMSVDRVASVYRPFLYKQYATPRVARIFCIFLTLFCLTMSALPFAGVGRYIFSTSSRYFCQFDWFPMDLPGTVYILAIGVCGALLISLMTFSNIVVFVIVVRIRRRMTKVLPSGRDETRRRARRVAFRQEERMAKFVALASVVFLVTWLPVTIRVFCNAFRVYPSEILDTLSLRLVMANFFLDPFTYVLFKKSFKRNLKHSFTELTEFLGDVGLSQKLKRQISRTIETPRAEMENASVFGHAYFVEMSMMEVNQLRTENLATVS